MTEFALFLQRGVLSAKTAGLPTVSTDYNDPPEILDFLLSSSAWVVESQNGVRQYTPGIAPLKGGGVTVDSAIVDSRTWSATPLDTVVDTIVLTPNANASEESWAYMTTQIIQFAYYANEFQSSDFQVQPVYLGRQLRGDVGKLYFVVYDISFAMTGDVLGDDTSPQSLTLSITRDPYGTPIPRGSNPKFYTFERRGLIPGQDYDSGDLSLSDWQNANVNHRSFVEEQVYNIYTTEPTPDLLNFIDIPKEDIPGDGPCLVEMYVDRDDSAQLLGLAVARYSGPLNATLSTNVYAETAGLSSPAGITSTFQIDGTRGILSTPGGAALNDYVTQHVLAAGAITENTFVSWPIQQLYYGAKYDVWCRCQLTSGVASDFPFYGLLSDSSVSTSFQLRLDTVTPPVTIAATADTGIVYLGRLDFTQISRYPMAIGSGESGFVDEGFLFSLRFAGRSGGAAATLRITDLLFIPYDECAMYIPGAAMSLGVGVSRSTTIDNTGYVSRLRSDGAVIRRDVTIGGNDVYIPLEMRGQYITLHPGRDNRLYFYHFLVSTSTTSGSMVNNSGNRVIMRVRLNILPQWRMSRSVL